jgi:hypothetical protein
VAGAIRLIQEKAVAPVTDPSLRSTAELDRLHACANVRFPSAPSLDPEAVPDGRRSNVRTDPEKEFVVPHN